jgi:hypothetical protein
MPDSVEKIARPIKPQVAANVAASKPVTYIIAIGIDVYASPVVDDFYNNNCLKDRDDLVSCLLEDYEHFEVFRQLENENATKANIEKAIKDFVSDTATYNRAENSLLIFYSGHGGEVPIGRSGKTGCWIPHGCQEREARQVIPYNQLTETFRELVTENLLVIVDACMAAKIFDGNRPDSGNYEGGESPDVLMSKWALVSSRSDEPSRTNGPNKNSVFTTALLASLKSNVEADLLLETINADITRVFLYNRSQWPLCNRLLFTDEVNNGPFKFHLRDVIAERKKIREILETGISALNYEDQYRSFNHFTMGSKQFAVFSGTPACGIKFLLHQIKEKYFGAEMDYHPPAAFADAFGAEDVPFRLFNAALGYNWQDEASLQNHIAELLTENHTVFEFIFYNEGGQFVPDAQKRGILDALGKFVANIPNPSGANYLIILIVDLENCDYLNLYPGSELNGVPALFVPKVGVLDHEKVRDWFDGVKRINVPEKYKLAEFEALFKQRLVNRLSLLIEESGGAPGQALRLICQYAECDDLVLQMDI